MAALGLSCGTCDRAILADVALDAAAGRNRVADGVVEAPCSCRTVLAVACCVGRWALAGGAAILEVEDVAIFGPDERVKVTVYILDTRLRADGVKVSVFRQEKNDAGEWIDAEVDLETALQLENKILDRARLLKNSQLG